MGEIGVVRQIDINVEMEEAYLDYAMSVIVSRALPDVRDGLKPVHRRILYAMYDMGLRPDRPYKKSARIVGEVLGKYHPHGDAAVYDTMVRLAQDFSMRYMLVDGQGNFGSVDGDSAAAMRYTEARLASAAMEMLADIEKQTVEFRDNFDASMQEPTVLPSALPNLLVNGASGIAVGMSTNVPPHNLGEICDALNYLIERYETIEDVTAEDLMRFVKGPDFPTGGIVYRYRDDRNHDSADTILNAYATGRGSIVMQARTHVEEMSRGRSRIVVTELPYQTNKSNLIERIAELAREGRIEGLTDLRDESDRRGMRVVIELTRNVEASKLLTQLFKLTPLRQTFGVNLLALVDGQPRLLSLKRALQLFLEHRQVMVRRRSEYDLAKARERLHIVEGLRIALDHMDEVIETIRRSRTTETARQNLIKRFALSEMQANAILDMQLRRLAQLERRRIEEEYNALRQTISYLIDLLANPAKILQVIQAELAQLKETYGDARRTQIITESEYTGEVRQETLIPNQPVLVTVSQRGEIQRQLNPDRLPRRGGDFDAMAVVGNRNEIVLLTPRGRGFRIPVHQLPEKTGRSNGDPLMQVVREWEKSDRVAALIEVRPDGGYLTLVTAQGRVMRVAASELASIFNGTQVINVETGDALIWAGMGSGSGEIVMVSRQGMGIRFREEEVRPTGMGAMGVAGLKLEEKHDRVVGAGLSHDGDLLMVASERGTVKTTPLSEYNIQGRHGKGLQAMRLNPQRTGLLGGAAVVTAQMHVTVRTTKRNAHDVRVADVPTGDRYAIGAPLIEVAERESVSEVWAWPVVEPHHPGTKRASTEVSKEGPAPQGESQQPMPLSLESSSKRPRNARPATAQAPVDQAGRASGRSNRSASSTTTESEPSTPERGGKQPTALPHEPSEPEPTAEKKLRTTRRRETR